MVTGFPLQLRLSGCGRLVLVLMTAGIPVVAGFNSEGVQGSSGLQGARGLKGGSPGLRISGIQPATRQKPVRIQAARTRLNEPVTDAVMKGATAKVARDDLSETKLQGAASSIPKSRIGELLFDVARELEGMEQDMTEVAVGYYMAALADPEGHRHEAARERLHEIFLDEHLSREEAVRLYDEGKSILTELSEPRIGLTREGLASARRDLGELRAAYHRQRELRAAEAPPVSQDDPASEGQASD